MLALLPLLVFALVFFFLRRRFENLSSREAFLATAVVLGTLVVLATEFLSLWGVIGFPAIAAYWIALAVLAGGMLLLCRRQEPSVAPGTEKLPRLESVLLAGVGLYVVVTAVIAIIAPPNTWDSMEYHLPKVMHWIQNGSVAFYPTAIPRQNHLAPGAEFWVLHLHLLSGSNRFANLVEWFSMVGSLVAVSLIARQLGAQRLGQCLAVVFTATLPMGIMQATSTMTDYVVAFWFVCFAHYFLRSLQSEKNSWPVILALSASLGLAVFTKGTTYLFAPGLLVWLALSTLKRFRTRAIIPFAIIAAGFLVINAGHYARNWDMYRHLLGPREEPMSNSQYGIQSHTPAALLSTLSKHIGTHINSPWPQFNQAVQNRYEAFHRAIGWPLNDPRITWGPSWTKFKIGLTDFHEETAGNPIHFLLAIACVALLLLTPSLRQDRLLVKYTLAIIAGFFLFGFYLKWHPWMSRLHHGIFVAAAPFVAVILTRIFHERLSKAVAVLLLLLGLPWLFLCLERPALGKETIFNTPRDRLFFKTPYQKHEASFLAGQEFLAKQKLSQVGLIVTNSSWEYLWWVFLKRAHPDIRIEHVNVQDVSARLQTSGRFRDFSADALITLDQRPQPETISVGALVYTRRWAQDKVAIYLRD